MLKVTVGDATILVAFQHTQTKKTYITQCFLKTAGNAVFAQGEAKKYKNDPLDKNLGRKLALKRALEAGGVTKEARVAIWTKYFDKRALNVPAQEPKKIIRY